MSEEMNVYELGQDVDNSSYREYDETTVRSYGDFISQITRSKNTDTLWAHFHKNENYPEYYMGSSKRTAICKCPITGIEEWYNGERCLNIENPEKGSTVTVEFKNKDTIYTREFIFIGWVKTPVHEWKMKKGTILMLEQKFVDGLLPADKKYLKIYS
jgi:hypothetical protein